MHLMEELFLWKAGWLIDRICRHVVSLGICVHQVSWEGYANGLADILGWQILSFMIIVRVWKIIPFHCCWQPTATVKYWKIPFRTPARQIDVMLDRSLCANWTTCLPRCCRCCCWRRCCLFNLPLIYIEYVCPLLFLSCPLITNRRLSERGDSLLRTDKTCTSVLPRSLALTTMTTTKTSESKPSPTLLGVDLKASFAFIIFQWFHKLPNRRRQATPLPPPSNCSINY